MHSPGSRLRRMLSVILPCEARTFLAIRPFGILSRERTVWYSCYYIENFVFVKFLKGDIMETIVLNGVEISVVRKNIKNMYLRVNTRLGCARI